MMFKQDIYGTACARLIANSIFFYKLDASDELNDSHASTPNHYIFSQY